MDRQSFYLWFDELCSALLGLSHMIGDKHYGPPPQYVNVSHSRQ